MGQVLYEYELSDGTKIHITEKSISVIKIEQYDIANAPQALKDELIYLMAAREKP